MTALQYLHKIYRDDLWVKSLFSAAGVSLADVAQKIQDITNSNFFDLMPEKTVKSFENIMGITPTSGQTLDDRRAVIEARWKSDGKVSIDLIQAVCDSWKNGEIACTFTGGKITCTFVGAYGVPNDMDSLKTAIDDAKPAHLAVEYIIKYLLIRDVAKMTITQLNETPLSSFAGRR